MTSSPLRPGLSGRIAALFISSKLTPLVMLGSLLLGLFAVLLTPREEEPQIVVPMADVWLPFPGASAKVVEEQITKPIERKLSEIKGVEYLYSLSRPGGALIIVRFYVGEPMEQSLVDLYDKLMSNQDLLPPGAGPFVGAGGASAGSPPAFMVKPRDVNDVPIVTLTLSSDRYTDFQLRQLADSVLEEVKKVAGTSGGFTVGGRQRELRVQLDPTRLKAYGMTPLQIAGVIRGENKALPSGRFESQNREYLVETGRFIRSREDLEALVVGVHPSGTRLGRDLAATEAAGAPRPIYLRQVAEVTDGPGEATSYVWFGTGPIGTRLGSAAGFLSGEVSAESRSGSIAATEAAGAGFTESSAVTVAIAKQANTNAVTVARGVVEKMEELKGALIPADVRVTVTRDYGETANDKANELLWHLLIAVVSVVLFLGLALGPRPALVVSLAIPLTLALTLFTSMLIGYTINRVTLFALIFSIGILVDDAIVVVENTYRHLQLRRLSHRDASIYAVDEVGNPTILATFTVIAALLPMAFVSGLMGPYMRPIPVNASIAMFFSLLVAFVVIPWFCQTCYRGSAVMKGVGHEDEQGWTYRLYQRLLSPLLAHPLIAWVFLAFVALLLVASVSLFYTRGVVVKMLPFDNKSELQLVIDMPEGTTLEETANVAKALTRFVQAVPEVRDYQAYVGTASPFNFNGLVRHYFLRDEPHQADIQINLTHKDERKAQSHEIAQRIRPEVQRLARQYGANVKVVEVPPGPPVQSVLVAEVYGPDYGRQIAVARDLRKLFESTPGVVDVDDSIEADQTKYVFTVDRAKAALAGIPSDEIVNTLRMALEGMKIGLVHIPREKSQVQIVLRLPLAERTGLEHLGEIALKARTDSAPGASAAASSRASSVQLIPLSELLTVEQVVQEKTIYHKNQKPVVYVTGDVGGAGANRAESPVYGVLGIGKQLESYRPPEGYLIEQHYAAQPWSEATLAMKWDGEWHITYETFRDMGLAFAVAMLLIYLLIVGQFQSFLTPVIIMAPIPLTLIGILPGHWLTGSYFTATSMIGFIALAGIIVRNSILLVDFIQLQQEQGVPITEAVIRAGAIRTRPILLTAAALMVGAFVIILDPIFQGLAVSLLFGVGAATLLTLVVIPILYSSLMGGRRTSPVPPPDSLARSPEPQPDSEQPAEPPAPAQKMPASVSDQISSVSRSIRHSG